MGGNVIQATSPCFDGCAESAQLTGVTHWQDYINLKKCTISTGLRAAVVNENPPIGKSFVVHVSYQELALSGKLTSPRKQRLVYIALMLDR
jgi:hypothetical protein